MTDEQAHSPISRVVVASAIGTTIEWYDFFLYGTAAGIVFNKLFFPQFNSLVGTLIAFATFAIGFVARPLGGIIFGHFGDRVGRKTALIITMVIMGVGTFAIGLLPGYASWGIWAPILLVVLRVIQGIGIGGEWGGAVLMAVEHAPDGRRGYYGSWPQIGVPAGLMLGTGAFAGLSAALSNEAFLAWGWRVAFLLSAVLIAVGLYVRLQIVETPAFQRVREEGATARVPMVELVRTAKGNTFLGMGARMAEGVSFNTWGVFSIAYATTTLKLSRTDVLLGVMLASAVAIGLIPVCGALSDRLGRTRLFAWGALAFAAAAFPAFRLFETRSLVVAILVLVVALGLLYPLMYGPEAAMFSELFETRIRYTGASFVYQGSGILASGMTPLILTALLAAGGHRPWLMTSYMVLVGLLSAGCAWLIGRRGRATATSRAYGPTGAVPPVTTMLAGD